MIPTVSQFIVFTLVLSRVAALIMTAPIYATNDVPFRVRILLAVALAMLVAPLQWHTAIATPGGLAQYGILLGGEALIGACLGLGILILVHAMTLAGELITQVSGMSLAEVFDPALGENVPLFSRLLFLLTIAVFLCIGGHRMLMAGLLDTFHAIPPGSAGMVAPESLCTVFVTLVGQTFALGVRAAAPAVTALLLAILILGLVGRTVPQLNILSLGLGMNTLLAFAATGLSLGAAIWAFRDQIQPAMTLLLEALQTPLQPHWML